MENQHRKIKGYRELTLAEIDLMNEIKQKGEEFGALARKVREHVDQQYRDTYCSGDESATDRLEAAEPIKWCYGAVCDMQTALMKLTRAVAQPTTF